jgi:short-subunit dehydrogenase
MNARQLIALGMAASAAVVAARHVRRNCRRVSFAGSSIVISGASRGLGLIMARQLAAEGARLTLLARSADELAGAAEQLRSLGAEPHTIPCDVGKRDEIQSAVKQAAAHFGRIDVLINNAGIVSVGPLDHMTEADFEEAMRIHFWGPLHATLAALPHMRRQGAGRIVNVSSIGGKVAVPHLVPYSASKFALVGLSDGLRAELAQENIRVTTVCPGLMRTGSCFNALFRGKHEKEFAWFALSDSFPLVSINAERAAAQIIDACRHADPYLVISTQARAADIINTVFPGITADMMAMANRFLPQATHPGGNRTKTGWQSRSALAPDRLLGLSLAAAETNNEIQQVKLS